MQEHMPNENMPVPERKKCLSPRLPRLRLRLRTFSSPQPFFHNGACSATEGLAVINAL